MRHVGHLVSHRGQLPFELLDALFECPDFLAQGRQARPEARGQRRLGIADPRADVGTTWRAPTGMVTPNSRNSPRSVLSRAVRVRIHVVRTRWRDATACCGTDLTGTG